MRLFDNYLNNISNIITKQDGLSHFDGVYPAKESRQFSKSRNEIVAQRSNFPVSNKTLFEFNGNELTKLFGTNKASFDTISIGAHPDFKDIQHGESLYHYCVSMFVDIKGSTRLNGRYSLEEIRLIKDSVLSLAIQVSSLFGGHVQRLQGDGIFLQFVRKGISEKDAVINALNAASVLTNFISTDLADLFNNADIKPLKIRTGIDLGYEKDVLWSHYGIVGCSELTTTSFHTDIAAKLQADSDANGIYVGQNVKEVLDIKPEFCENVVGSDNNTDYYIFRNNSFSYRKYKFNWLTYLNSFNFTKLNETRSGVELDSKKQYINCYISDSFNLFKSTYYQNSTAISKDSKIKFELMENGHPYFKRDFDEIKWFAYNSGEEAKQANMIKHDFGGAYNNKTYCETTAAYTGHHYVECVIVRNFSDNIKLQFPLFI